MIVGGETHQELEAKITAQQKKIDKAVRELDHLLYLLGSEISPAVLQARKIQEGLRR